MFVHYIYRNCYIAGIVTFTGIVRFTGIVTFTEIVTLQELLHYRDCYIYRNCYIKRNCCIYRNCNITGTLTIQELFAFLLCGGEHHRCQQELVGSDLLM